MANLQVVKSADQPYLLIGQSNTIQYIITITNTGTGTARFVTFKDMLPVGVTFVPGSLTINGSPQEVFGVEQPLTIGKLTTGASAVVMFKAQLVPGLLLTQIANQAVVTYCDGTQTQTVLSNTLITPLINLNVITTKTVDKAAAIVGDILRYTIQVRNAGALPITNAVLYDVLPPELTFLPGTVTVNLQPVAIQNLAAGIPLGTLAPNATALITFQAKVTTLPTNGRVCNQAAVQYNYSLMVNGMATGSIGQSCAAPICTIVTTPQGPGRC